MHIRDDRRLAFDNDDVDVLLRAYDGACWSAGIPNRRRANDTSAMVATRDALAQAIMRFASAGVRDVQTLKASALMCVAEESFKGPAADLPPASRRALQVASAL